MLLWCEQKRSKITTATATEATAIAAAAAIDVKPMCCMIYYFIQIMKGTHFESHMNIIKRHFNHRSPPFPNVHNLPTFVPIDLWMMQTTNIAVNHFSRIFFKLSLTLTPSNLPALFLSLSLSSSVFIHRSSQIDCWEIWRMLYYYCTLMYAYIERIYHI